MYPPAEVCLVFHPQALTCVWLPSQQQELSRHADVVCRDPGTWYLPSGVINCCRSLSVFRPPFPPLLLKGVPTAQQSIFVRYVQNSGRIRSRMYPERHAQSTEKLEYSSCGRSDRSRGLLYFTGDVILVLSFISSSTTVQPYSPAIFIGIAAA